MAEWVVGRAFRAVLRTTMSFGCHIEDWKDLVFRIRTSSTRKEKIVMSAKLLDFDIIAKTFGPNIFRTHNRLAVRIFKSPHRVDDNSTSIA